MTDELDPTDLRAQQAAESQEDDAKRLQQQVDDSDFVWLMGEKRGRRLVWRQWLSPTGIFRNPFAGNSDVTNFRCGEMNIGQKLMARIHTLCPEKYHLMVQEQQDYDKRHASRARNK